MFSRIAIRQFSVARPTAFRNTKTMLNAKKSGSSLPFPVELTPLFVAMGVAVASAIFFSGKKFLYDDSLRVGRKNPEQSESQEIWVARLDPWGWNFFKKILQLSLWRYSIHFTIATNSSKQPTNPNTFKKSGNDPFIMVTLASQKLEFKKLLFKLADPSKVYNQTSPYWDQLITFNINNNETNDDDDTNDMFTIITNKDIRSIRINNPTNFYLLIRTISVKLIFIANNKNFPNNSSKTYDIRKLLNCLKILSRFLPFLFENDSKGFDENEIFWKKSNSLNDNEINNQSINDNLSTVGSNTSASSITNILHDDESIKVAIDSKHVNNIESAKAVINGNNSHAPRQIPLGAQLIYTCINLLFTKHFTIPETNESIRGVEYSVWEPGVGENGNFMEISKIIDAYRLEILRLTMVLCSKNIYYKSNELLDNGSRFLTVLVVSLPKLKLLTLICSLINITIRELQGHINQNQNQPRNKLRTLVTTYSIQLLTLTLSYPIPSNDVEFIKHFEIFNNPTNDNYNQFPPNNLVRLYLSKIYKPGELIYIIKNCIEYLKSSLVINGKPNLWCTEIIMLLWEFFQCNKNIVKCIVMGKSKFNGEIYSNQLLMILIYHVSYFHNLKTFQNQRRIMGYFLLFLSSHYLVCNDLLQPIPHNTILPEHFVKNNLISKTIITYRDLIIHKTSQLIIHSYNSNDLLLPTYFEWLYNLIPLKVVTKKPISKDYGKGYGLSYQSSTIIIQLIIKSGTLRFLTENSMNPDLLSLLIRALVLEIQYNKDSLDRLKYLIYVLGKNKRIFVNILSIINSFNDNKLQLDLSSDSDESEEDLHNQQTQQTHSINNDENQNSFRPAQPIGMSDKAKGKQSINASFSESWSGLNSLKVLISMIDLFRTEVEELKNSIIDITNTTNRSMIEETLNQIVQIKDFESKINNIDQGLKPKPLKFIWSKVSLGWYLSVLWSKIYENEVLIDELSGDDDPLIKNSGIINTIGGLFINNGTLEENSSSIFSRFNWMGATTMENGKNNNDNNNYVYINEEGVVIETKNLFEFLKKIISKRNFYKDTRIQLFKVINNDQKRNLAK